MKSLKLWPQSFSAGVDQRACDADIEKHLSAELKENRSNLKRQLAELESRRPKPPTELTGMIAGEIQAEPPKTFLLAGGSYDKPLTEVTPGFLSEKTALRGLEKSLATRPLPGASGSAADQLRQAAAGLAGLSAEEQAKLAERLAALAAAQQEGNQDLAEALDAAAAALRAGDTGAAATALGAAAGAQAAAEASVTGQEAAAQALGALRHRGPDDSGTEFFPFHGGECALGSTRLSIVDLSSAGHMPMSTADGLCSLVFNGEIYDAPLHRRDLERSGVSFKSRTDTEVLLYGLTREGPAFLDRIDGMYAFAFWDQREPAALSTARPGLSSKGMTVLT